MLIRDVAWETCQWIPVAPPETWRRSITKFRTERKLRDGCVRREEMHVVGRYVQVVLVHIPLCAASDVWVDI